jgi:undecaprenyl-phosphate 4-deoxy-4-formamido-L-arabinose transferase
MSSSSAPVKISIVVPVYNEQEVLPELFEQLYRVMDGLDSSYEILFVDDGSRDGSVGLLRAQFAVRPDVTRVILLRANSGQHAAIMAGFSRCRGDYVITMDADLQNPPSEIPKIIQEMDAGHDYVGSIRDQRRDRLWRHVASRLMNRVRERITDIRMTDQGCMFRGYHRDIVKILVGSNERQTFIPALGYLYAANPAEIEVRHEERFAGKSKYSLFKLIHLNLDLITSFSTVPLHVFSMIGMLVSALSFVFVIYLFVRRLVVGPEAEGLFTLFAIAFFLFGLLLLAVGILGEYLGRVYGEVRNRPSYTIAAQLEDNQPTDEHPT